LHIVRSIIIDEVQVVRSEVHTAKRRVSWDSKASYAAPGQRRVQVWCHSQGAGVGIVTLASNGGPDNVDGIESIVLWVCHLTEEVCGTFTGNIDLRMID
jgi:hypothetical protein